MIDDFRSVAGATEHLSYDESQQIFFKQAYGQSDFHERQLRASGYDAHTIVFDCDEIQAKFQSKQHNAAVAGRFAGLLHQLGELKPSILYLENVFIFSHSELAELRQTLKTVRLMIGFLGSAYTVETLEKLRVFDLIVTCCGEMAREFKAAGLTVLHLMHAFDPSVLRSIEDSAGERRHALTFIGALTSGVKFHHGRNEVLSYLVKEGLPLEIFGKITQGTSHFRPAIQALTAVARWAERAGIVSESDLPSLFRRLHSWVPRECMRINRAVRKRIQPPVYGLRMYRALKASAVTLNFHVKGARYAANMRLFEATGVGTCLVTDWKENMSEIFEDKTEVVTYRSKEECLDKVNWLLQHPEEALCIGRAGQLRCLNSHTYKHRAVALHQCIRNMLA